MTKELLFSLASPSRDSLDVYGFRFGKKGGRKTVIISGLNGEEIMGVFVASQLVRWLREQTKQNPNLIDGEILIIPSVNHFALNMGTRFWPLDNTDINVMFPGYDKGETTQRIAYKLFEHIKDATYGIQLEDRKDKATCMPYIKLLQSGQEDIKGAKSFCLPFVHTKEFSPTDSGSLLYNWGVWETKGYCLVLGNQNTLLKEDIQTSLDSIIRFLSYEGVLDRPPHGGCNSILIHREQITIVKANHAGLFKPAIRPANRVKKGEKLGVIFDALTGTIKDEILAPHDGIVTCIYNYPLVYEHSVLFRIAQIG